jgi:RNA polymerase sigma-70 factor, ECF subfamily
MPATDAPDDRPPDLAAPTSMTLLARIRSADVDQVAWDRLVFLYGPQIRIWVGRRGVTGSDADDVVQDVFQAVLNGLATFRRDRPDDTFRGWLHGITRHVLLRRAERIGREFPAAGGTAALANLNTLPQETPDEPDPAAELNALYRRGLELVRIEFEARTWRAFWEHVVEGRTPADVAADLGVSPASVRQAKSRVLRRLREELGDLIE